MSNPYNVSYSYLPGDGYYALLLLTTGVDAGQIIPNDQTSVGVGCQELFEDSGEMSFNLTPEEQSGEGTRTFICDWRAGFAFMSALALQPHPNFPTLYAVSFKRRGFAPDTENNDFQDNYRMDKITVEYKTLKYPVSGWTEIEASTSMQNYAINSDGANFQDVNGVEAKVEYDPQKLIPIQEYTITQHNQPYLPEDNFKYLAGQLNCCPWSASDFTSNETPNPYADLGMTIWPAGQVLYCGYKYKVKTGVVLNVGSDGVSDSGTRFEIEHKLQASPNDFRKEFNPNTGMFDMIVLPGAGGSSSGTGANGQTFKYDLGDFSLLYVNANGSDSEATGCANPLGGSSTGRYDAFNDLWLYCVEDPCYDCLDCGSGCEDCPDCEEQ